MEDDEQEDVKKMTEFINKQKSSYQNNVQLEFEDFVNFKQDYSDQEFDEDDEESCYEVLSIKTLYLDNAPGQELVFTEEEQNTIDSCTEPELKKLLILNRSKNMQLIKLHKKIQGFLAECEAEIEEKKNVLKNSEPKHLNQQTFIWKLAAPYFKDKKFFPCPLNSDAMRKRNRDELSVYDLNPSPKWTPIEFDRLNNAVKCNYNINRQNNIVSKISALKNKMKSGDEDKSLVEEILNLKEQLEELKIGDDKLPPLNSNEFISWYKVAETFLKDKHTAVECESVWHMLLHPDINKLEWTKEENKSLETIAKQHSFQNWDEIAAELSTNRTGFTTCLHYHSKLCDKFKRSKFIPEEDKFLLEVVDIYKVGNFIPWNKVVCHFNNRSRHQLYHRYTYFLSQNHVKRGKFSEAEDILLIILVNKFGRNFKKCAEYMPHRSQVQLKSRYNSNLQRHIKKGTFTSEDDEVIYDYAKKFGEKSWSNLATKLRRCNAQIRQRYKLIKTFLQENPQASVADIPKRRHRFDQMNEGQHDFLNYMAEQYKDTDEIPTLSVIEESLQAELISPNLNRSFQKKINKPAIESSEAKPKNIDAMLTDLFTSSIKMKQCGVITEAYLNEATDNANQILKLLGVKLYIPKDLENDHYVDNVDVKILERISKNNNLNQTEVSRLIPPNLNTLVGLRSLILKHKECKSQQKSKYFASTSKCNPVSSQTDEGPGSTQELEKHGILYHRELFSQRFDMLFDWSAFLSLEKPNQLSVPEQVTANNLSSTSKKTYSKRQGPQNTSAPKKRKIDVSALTDLSKNPQLKSVDKQVVEDLIKKNNIKVIRLDSISGLNIKRVSKPTSNVNHSRSEPSVSSADDSVTISSNSSPSTDNENIVTNDDLQDVETLNTLLKTLKSEANTGPSCQNDEYQAIKGDVQLLKEILQYEKIQVKSDPEGS
ncbi:hypothetical protein Zmor_006708 [Zophobas morio]|uniref:snRNA-activating protein complex subunit 4 n=2 Tax=Zophobas morio TaxID=2755281 RepID=A0AA38J0I6_9CUCU|nr:hypothetical protein Zmor_006708 [Zophobas morio]